MKTLGINIGSTSLKMVLLEEGNPVWSGILPHEGDFATAARKLLEEGAIPLGTPTLVTGNEGRFMFGAAGTLEPCYPATPDSLEFCAFPTGKHKTPRMNVWSLRHSANSKLKSAERF